MKALVYHGADLDPGIVDPTDAIVRIDSSTICGSDLHILKGDVPETTPGTILGHTIDGVQAEYGGLVDTLDDPRADEPRPARTA